MENSDKSPIRIILTGPESTGKTELCGLLATLFDGKNVPEYARGYILGLGRHYTYEDVVHIAEKQLELMNEYRRHSCNYIFIDTYLIITKVWFRRVFNKIPLWIDSEIAKTKDALYLLCNPDLPWEPDGVRENGGEMREILFDEYEKELQQAGLNYAYVKGFGKERVNCAENKIRNFIET